MTERKITIQEAMAILIEAGFAIEHSKFMVYRTKLGDYELLAFNSRADLKEDSTENFDNLHDAIAKMIRRVGKERIGE